MVMNGQDAGLTLAADKEYMEWLAKEVARKKAEADAAAAAASGSNAAPPMGSGDPMASNPPSSAGGQVNSSFPNNGGSQDPNQSFSGNNSAPPIGGQGTGISGTSGVDPNMQGVTRINIGDSGSQDTTVNGKTITGTGSGITFAAPPIDTGGVDPTLGDTGGMDGTFDATDPTGGGAALDANPTPSGDIWTEMVKNGYVWDPNTVDPINSRTGAWVPKEAPPEPVDAPATTNPNPSSAEVSEAEISGFVWDPNAVDSSNGLLGSWVKKPDPVEPVGADDPNIDPTTGAYIGTKYDNTGRPTNDYVNHMMAQGQQWNETSGQWEKQGTGTGRPSRAENPSDYANEPSEEEKREASGNGYVWDDKLKDSQNGLYGVWVKDDGTVMGSNFTGWTDAEKKKELETGAFAPSSTKGKGLNSVSTEDGGFKDAQWITDPNFAAGFEAEFKHTGKLSKEALEAFKQSLLTMESKYKLAWQESYYTDKTAKQSVFYANEDSAPDFMKNNPNHNIIYMTDVAQSLSDMGMSDAAINKLMDGTDTRMTKSWDNSWQSTKTLEGLYTGLRSGGLEGQSILLPNGEYVTDDMIKSGEVLTAIDKDGKEYVVTDWEGKGTRLKDVEDGNSQAPASTGYTVNVKEWGEENRTNVQNFNSTLQSLLDSDLSTAAGQAALLGGLASPIHIPHGYTWDKVKGTLTFQADMMGGAAMTAVGGVDETGEVTGGTPVDYARISAADEAILTAALSLRDMGQDYYEATSGTRIANVMELQQEKARQEANAITDPRKDFLETARSNTKSYMTTLNTALNDALSSGDFKLVNNALMNSLPVIPAGLTWDRATSRFTKAMGYEDRDITPEAQRWRAMAAPAYKLFDRASQLASVGNSLTLKETDRQRKLDADEVRFRELMASGDMNNAEKVLVEIKQAELEAIKDANIRENLALQMQAIQNPLLFAQLVKAGVMADFDKLTGSNLVDTIKLPEDGEMPNWSDWNSGYMDPEEKWSTEYAWLANNPGSSRDDFERMIASTRIQGTYAKTPQDWSVYDASGQDPVYMTAQRFKWHYLHYHHFQHQVKKKKSLKAMF